MCSEEKEVHLSMYVDMIASNIHLMTITGGMSQEPRKVVAQFTSSASSVHPLLVISYEMFRFEYTLSPLQDTISN